jgi:hypothetical protein
MLIEKLANRAFWHIGSHSVAVAAMQDVGGQHQSVGESVLAPLDRDSATAEIGGLRTCP